MARLLALILVFGLIVLVSIRRLNAETLVLADDVQPQRQTAAVSGIQHIVWVWFENREASAITAATAPYFTSFAAANVNLTNFYGVSHPSQPNYLDGFSGSNQGVTGDGYVTFPASTDNLAKQLAAAGKSWRVFAQNFPGSCFDGTAFTGGVDGPGLAGQYVRKHNPVIAFESVRLDAIECAKVQPLANFDPTVNFAMVVPNMTNDMHDGTTAQGDAFLQAFVPLVTASPDWEHTLLIVTFDEGSTSINGGGHIYTAAAAPWLAPAIVPTTYNHFSVLRTIEEVYGLPFLGSAASATTITELLPSTSTPTPTLTPNPTPSPTPTATATATPTATIAPSPTATPSEPCFERFDGVTAPALPIDWVAANPGPGDGTLWVTSIVTPDSAPNDAFIPDQAGISDKVLITPNITVTSASEMVTFRNNFNTESSGGIFRDGGVLEVSSPNINGGAFTDIIAPAVGGSFVLGGYTGSIDTTAGNPLAGRMAWSGDSGGYINTVVNLGPNVNGHTIKLRFRMGTDGTGAAPGWRIDTFYSAGLCVAPIPTPSPTATAIPTPSPTPSPAAQAVNLSTRMLVQAGDRVGIGGFIVTGSAPKRVIVRAIGPSLAQFGVPNPLSDTVLELHGPAGFSTLTNDNWRSSQEGEIIATGLPPTDDLESAIVANLTPGNYTGIISGKNNTTGVALIEVYDLDPAAASKLANISTRAFVSTGSDIMIAGFILGGGSANTNIIARGLGPSLAAFGISPVLADPTLELRDSNGTLLGANDNCMGSFHPPDPAEACIEASLPPGAFTAFLAGKNNGTGIGLVEIYDLGEQ